MSLPQIPAVRKEQPSLGNPIFSSDIVTSINTSLYLSKMLLNVGATGFAIVGGMDYAAGAYSAGIIYYNGYFYYCAGLAENKYLSPAATDVLNKLASDGNPYATYTQYEATSSDVPVGTIPQFVGNMNAYRYNLRLLKTDVSALQSTVGDASAGLVKDVDDLQATVGDASAGLVKDVDDLQATVGDASSGLVKDVDDLQATVGDASAGLVKDVDDLQSVANTSAEKEYLDFITDVEGMSPQEIECTEANPEQSIVTVADSLSLQTSNSVEATIVVPQKRCGTVIVSYRLDTEILNFKLAGGVIFYTQADPVVGDRFYWNTLGFPFVIKVA